MNNICKLIITIMIMFFLHGCKTPIKIFTQDTDYLKYHDFGLTKKEDGYYINILKKHNEKNMAIPAEWLTEPYDQDNILHDFVSTTNFHQAIASFEIGPDAVGLYLSSYDILYGGPAAAAAGRDVFLVYKPSENKIYSSEINLGISKYRIRDGGKFLALCHNFIISDINHDKYNDICITREEIVYENGSPIYKLHPAKWYLFKNDHWEYYPKFDGFFPIYSDFFVLPYFDMIKSPVDFVKDLSNLKYRKKN